MLLLNYICSQCVKHSKMPADLVMVKNIVTMDMGEQIGKLKKLDEVYKTYSYCLKTLNSYEFEFGGGVGFAKMQSIMQAFRGGDINEFGGKKVVKLLNFALGLNGLPKSDVLKFLLEDNCSIVVRPLGTESKLKTYISVSAVNKENAEKIEARTVKDAEKRLAC